MYALKTKGKYQFFCISKTEEELKKREFDAYYNWLGMQPKGSGKTKDDFALEFDRVKVTIEKI